jgi:hypothetical protein
MALQSGKALVQSRQEAARQKRLTNPIAIKTPQHASLSACTPKPPPCQIVEKKLRVLNSGHPRAKS